MSIDPELLAAYKNAEYVVFSDGCFSDLTTKQQLAILVDKPSRRLQALMEKKHCKQAAFITAYNPHSVAMTESENLIAQAKLIKLLHNMGLEFIEGVGRDPQRLWPEEKSVLVLNISKQQALNLARQFRQNAIVWIEADGIGKLLLLDDQSQ
ncbi:DUF3293 domain-containing protein [Aliiglaciecola sp. 3_MG-2023]|uniref:DUF3293 domain-containing protein n=1 Tax=Aliiglaciecola sp. 3_MG-2023 TaxID=3062644 RepID=UPI0026E34E25|nr:DUF3293 domain-containing protein [Aliiglaciecola sp. 3_MG-2023]MDO6694525.1 DUF3293 domain-containing protein [Aliiglaciecola sp. 3_MG-2023]